MNRDQQQELIKQLKRVVDTFPEEYIISERETIKQKIKLLNKRGKEFYKTELKDLRFKLKYINQMVKEKEKKRNFGIRLLKPIQLGDTIFPVDEKTTIVIDSKNRFTRKKHRIMNGDRIESFSHQVLLDFEKDGFIEFMAGKK